jgi:hypothetical protein
MGPKARCLCYCQTVAGLMRGTFQTRGGVCCLQLLPVFASAVILGSKSHGTHGHILLPQIHGSPNLEGQVPIFISPRNSVAQLYPRHWAPFSSFPTTRRTTVEVSKPASTQGTDSQCIIDSLCSLGTDHIKNTAYNSSSIPVCIHCLAMV